jgi:diacylglycerol kinase family enzyme
LAREIAAHPPELVIAFGGDGTLLLCASVLRDAQIPLGLIPGGSANGMAAELAIPESVEEALAVIERQHTIAADMLRFNDEHVGLHISDIGLNANLVKGFEASERRGFLGYAHGLINELTRPKPFTARLTLDGKKKEVDCLMVAFANAKRYGTGATLTQQGKLDDGYFEVYLLRELDWLGIAGQWFDHFPENQSYYEVHQVKKAEVQLDTPQSFQVDGELKGDTQTMSVDILPHCLTLIVGEPQA